MVHALHLDSGIHKSGVLDGVKAEANGDINILIMGLDSRLDKNGQPLPTDIYNALRAGNQADGGMTRPCWASVWRCWKDSRSWA